MDGQKEKGKEVASLPGREIVKKWVQSHSSCPGQVTWAWLARRVQS